MKALILFLLLNPDAPEPDDFDWTEHREEIDEVGRDGGWLTANETAYWPGFREAVAECVRLNAPPEHDIAMRWQISDEVLNAAIAFNWEFSDWCDTMAKTFPHRAETFRQAMADCREIRDIYNLLLDSRNRWCSLSRRLAAAELRDRIGPAWWAGSLPPPVPIKYFRQIADFPLPNS